MLFELPIYAIIGGLHFPLLKSGDFTLPRLIQYTAAADAPPWRDVKEVDVFQAIEAIKQARPQIVSLSPHDSSAWSIQQFREAFGERYVDLMVGKPIRL